MNTNKILAKVLKSISNGYDTTTMKAALSAVADGIEEGGSLGGIVIVEHRESGDQEEAIAPVPEAPISTAPVAEAAAEPEDESTASEGVAEYRILGDDERIMEGDEWKLKDGLRSRHPERLTWQAVTGSIGDRPSHYAKSTFRRRVVA